MSKFSTAVKNELHELLPAMLFFMLAFHMLSLTKAAVLDNYQITVASSTVATISAIIVAKTILLLGHTRLAQLFPSRVVYNLVWRTLLFGTVAVLLRQVEELVPVLLKHGDLGAALRETVEHLSTSRFLIIHMWLYTLLFIYSLVSEAVRLDGGAALKALLLGPLPPRPAHH